MNTIENNCKITNNSDKDLVVLNAFNSSTNVACKSTQQGYMQELELMTFTGDSQQILVNGASGTVLLDGTYTDSEGKTQPQYIYDLLISTPKSLFPIMTFGEALDFVTMAYPDITVTEAAAKNMEKALNFCKNIMTSPSSQMATAFQAAMNTAFSKGTITESDQVMAEFWNQYDIFAGLDFPSYVAVSTWMQSFVYLWGMSEEAQPGQTYYVYSAAAAGQEGVTSEGKIVFAKKASASSPADPTDHNSGMTITLQNNDESPTSLTFSRGQLIDSPGGAIALSGSFCYAGTFNGKQSDTTVLTILTGTILGKQVIALTLAPDSGWQKFWHSLSFSKLFRYFMEATGLWMALDFLKQKLFGKNKKLADERANENQGREPDPEQRDQARLDGDDIGDNARNEDQELLDRAAGQDVEARVPDQAEFDGAVSEVRADGAEALNDVARDNLRGGIDSAQEQIAELAEIEVNPLLEEAQGNLIQAEESLDGGDLSSAQSRLTDVTDQLPIIVEEMGEEVSEETKERCEEQVKVQEEVEEVVEETLEHSDSISDGGEEPFEEPFEI